jgi:mercuric reductase
LGCEESVASGTGRHEFDLTVLGGGSAGFAAAIRGAELGASVAMVSGGVLGGTCVNVGCVPSKTLIRAAEASHRLAHHGFAGVPRPGGAPDWVAVRRQKDALVSELRQSKYRDVLDAYERITLFESRGIVAPDGSVSLDGGSTLRAEKLVVTTGSSPWIAPTPGLAEAGYLDSASAMDLPSLPRSLAVIGGGYVGLELGQMFARLGVRVTLLARRARILRHEDAAIGTALAGYLRLEGMDIRTDASVERVERNGVYRIHVLQDREREIVTVDQLLVATGRRANARGFGLEEAGVRVGEKGDIIVDEYLRTSVNGIYAAGDATGEPMYVYVAGHAGALAAENALTGDAKPIDLTAVPKVTFTDPAVASVGFTEAEAKSRGVEALVSVLSLEHVPRALAARDTRGFIKLVAGAETRRLLGAQILAAEAGELITEPTLAIRYGLTIEDITSTLHPYLTLSEGIKLAAQAFDKGVGRLSCCAA